MCRNIRTLFNFEPPATGEEVRASALQFVRKLSGFAHPSLGLSKGASENLRLLPARPQQSVCRRRTVQDRCELRPRPCPSDPQ